MSMTRSQPHPRVWLVNLFFGAGPSPTGGLMESLAVALSSQGYQVEILTGTSSYNAAGVENLSRFTGRVHRLFSGPSAARGALGRLLCWATFYLSVAAFAFGRRLPDTVIVMTTPPLMQLIFVILRLLRHTKTRIVLWNQDTYPEVLAAVGLLRSGSLPYRLVQQIQKWATRRVDRAFVLDEAMAELLRGHGAQDVCIIPNWEIDVPISQIPLNDPIEQTVHKAQTTYRYLVLYTGNYGWGHDLSILFSYLQAHPRQRDYFFLFIGGGEKWPDIDRLIQFGVEGMATFGYVSKARVAALIPQADFGLVALETSCIGLISPSKIHGYLINAVPLLYIGPARSNVAEAIDQFHCGVRVPETDPEAMAQTLATLAQPDFDHASLSANAKNAAQQRYCESVAVANFLRALKAV